MGSQASATKATGDSRQPQTAQEAHDRKQRVLTQGRASITRSIADALVIKDGDVFFLSERNGNVPLDGAHGYGLYYHDCRFLNGYRFHVAGAELDTLASNGAEGFSAILELTNPDLRMRNGHLIQKEEISIRWERIINSESPSLDDRLVIRNFSQQLVEFPITLDFATGFEPLFEVRGLLNEPLGSCREPCWTDECLSFVYDGADKLYRALNIHFRPEPNVRRKTGATFHLEVGPKQTKEILISLEIRESPDETMVTPTGVSQPNQDQLATLRHRSVDEWLGEHTEVASDSLVLDQVMDRSLRDLRMLRSDLRDEHYFAAGVPWFVTLFGRDSLIAAMQMLAYEPGIAAQTLRLLASYQGQQVNHWRDEQPGKIPHELRVGEMAHLNEIPQTPYYGSVDATPLFLIVLGLHANWTGDLGLFRDLKQHVNSALSWITKYGQVNNDEYVAYRSTSEKGLVNQGWKDSGDAIVEANGSLAQPPIALVEVQGYVFLAWLLIAELFERDGDSERAQRLRQLADSLKSRFNRDFWLPEEQFFALALQQHNKPCAVVSSNPGQALWTGIVDADMAQPTVQRLMAPDMFDGWGVRTLAATERAYNPIGYHLGTVWPHDNSIIAAGLRRVGADEEFLRVFSGIVGAATHFPNNRLPEVFAGFGRDEYHTPVHYPVACHPQAWAAGSVPLMIAAALGLKPEAFDHRLRIVRPLMPEFADRIELRRLHVGEALVDLRFRRATGKHADAEVLKVEGELDIVIEKEGPS
jgi:glycogen debranching enzyme